jgi:hypothetical protein
LGGGEVDVFGDGGILIGLTHAIRGARVASEASARASARNDRDVKRGTVWESLRILGRADWIASDGVKGVGQIGRHRNRWASQKLDRSTRQRSPVEGSQRLLQQRSKMRCLLRVVADLIEEGIRSPGRT